MSYEISFVCDLCEHKSGAVSTIADVAVGKMLIVGTTNVGMVCAACETELISGINRARDRLSARLHRETSEPRTTRKTKVI